jgi:hypothetical protein
MSMLMRLRDRSRCCRMRFESRAGARTARLHTDVGVGEVQTRERRDPFEGHRDRPRILNAIMSLFLRSRTSPTSCVVSVRKATTEWEVR